MAWARDGPVRGLELLSTLWQCEARRNGWSNGSNAIRLSCALEQEDPQSFSRLAAGDRSPVFRGFSALKCPGNRLLSSAGWVAYRGEGDICWCAPGLCKGFLPHVDIMRFSLQRGPTGTCTARRVVPLLQVVLCVNRPVRLAPQSSVLRMDPGSNANVKTTRAAL